MVIYPYVILLSGLYLWHATASYCLIRSRGYPLALLQSCIDKLRHSKEWKDTGKSGEQILYRTLVDKFYVPVNQILRNVHIPTSDSKTSEIDLLVVSKKGLLVFECKITLAISTVT